MFPVFPSVLWMKIGAAVAVCAVMYFLGWNHEHKKLVAYQAEVAAAGKAQDEKNVAIAKEHQLITEGIKNEYEARLAAVNNYYARGLHDARTGHVPTNADTSAGVATDTAYADLARRCAETTLQLTELQNWIRSIK
jgi:hypothetical protein